MSAQHTPGRKPPAIYVKKCGRCNGAGAIACFSAQYSGKCFACNGTGKLFISKAEYMRLMAARAERIAAKAAGSAAQSADDTPHE